VREGLVASDPGLIAAFVRSHAPHVAKVGLETGATSTWLWTELNKIGLPVICIDARHAKAALRMQIPRPRAGRLDLSTSMTLAQKRNCRWWPADHMVRAKRIGHVDRSTSGA
jgi:transposase